MTDIQKKMAVLDKNSNDVNLISEAYWTNYGFGVPREKLMPSPKNNCIVREGEPVKDPIFDEDAYSEYKVT